METDEQAPRRKKSSVAEARFKALSNEEKAETIIHSLMMLVTQSSLRYRVRSFTPGSVYSTRHGGYVLFVGILPDGRLHFRQGPYSSDSDGGLGPDEFMSFEAAEKMVYSFPDAIELEMARNRLVDTLAGKVVF